jgi:DNA replication and repair protein RecF
MTLDSLDLLLFKNYEEAHLSFARHVNCLTGPNGSGKTNLLDAIHYLALTKSAFASADQLSIRHGANYAMIRGRFLPTPEVDAPAPTEVVQVNLHAVQKKTVLLNRAPYEKLSEHIGRFPLVLLSPYDTDLVREGSEERRRFFDGILSQRDPAYLETLLRYNGLLRQRNATLKQFAERRRTDLELLAVIDEQLVPPGRDLTEARARFLVEFEPLFQRHYAHLTDGAESVGLTYRSQLLSEEDGGDFGTLLAAAQRTDLALARSTVGPHKDDFEFLLLPSEAGYDQTPRPVKQLGSQGQQKSFVIALKLAQFELLAARHRRKPLLLLDDIFDRLDERRIQRLLTLVADGTFGQIFLTDSHPHRAAALLRPLTSDLKEFRVENGRVGLDH